MAAVGDVVVVVLETIRAVSVVNAGVFVVN